jgi:periplasmic protein TonB
MSAFSPSLSPSPAAPRPLAGGPSPAQQPTPNPGVQAADPGWQGAAGENPWALAAVGVLHLALLGWLTHAMGHSPAPVVPPALVGMLVEAPPVIEPVPLPVEVQPKPVPQPVVQPKTVQPPPVAPPSERAVSAPPPEPVAPPTAEPAVAAPTPPAPAPTPAPVAAPEPVTPPRSDAAYLKNPLPPYPRESNRLQEEGQVMLSVYILADGTAGEIKLKRSSGYPRLDKAAMETVQRWRFQPARRGNEAIPWWYDVPVTFSLER